MVNEWGKRREGDACANGITKTKKGIKIYKKLFPERSHMQKN
jgi:hypothetical protein